jgi:hypothetical protein
VARQRAIQDIQTCTAGRGAAMSIQGLVNLVSTGAVLRWRLSSSTVWILQCWMTHAFAQLALSVRSALIELSACVE